MTRSVYIYFLDTLMAYFEQNQSFSHNLAHCCVKGINKGSSKILSLQVLRDCSHGVKYYVVKEMDTKQRKRTHLRVLYLNILERWTKEARIEITVITSSHVLINTEYGIEQPRVEKRSK